MEAMKIDSEKNLHRKHSTYKLLDERFEIQKEMYRGQQYSQIYFARLHMMRTLLYSLVPNWKPHLPVCRVLGLERDKECIIVGTLYKRMKLKPCVLDEYSKTRTVTPLVKPHNFVHPDDHLIFEDESGRVKLSGNVLSLSVTIGIAGNTEDIRAHSGIWHHTKGTIVGLHGKETDAGDFLVLDVLGAGLPPQIELPLKSSTRYCSTDHVVIAGNSIEVPRGLLNGQNLASKDQSRLSEPIKELDILLTQVCLWISFDLDDVRFLGTSGQNIDDLDKYSEATDKLDFIERTLRWRHLAPTAPNTLGCYPFTDRDPFLIESCPHVYFVGNQDKYDSRLVRLFSCNFGSEGPMVRLISIPKFCETGVAVVLNLGNHECHTLSFGTQFSS